MFFKSNTNYPKKAKDIEGMGKSRIMVQLGVIGA